MYALHVNIADTAAAGSTLILESLYYEPNFSAYQNPNSVV